jgi:hypothetical protein
MVRFVVLVMALLLVAVGQTRADPVLFSNGPINGTADAWGINFGSSVADSFTLVNASNVTGVQLGLWTFGPSPATVQWSIGTSPFGSDQGSGTANLTSIFHNNNNNFGAPWSVYSATFPLNEQLASGTYWLTLQNATASGSYVAWDQSSGSSSASTQYVGTDAISIPSESFQILGTEAVASPEPASITLLGIGIAGLAGYGWRSRAKNRSKNAVARLIGPC